MTATDTVLEVADLHARIQTRRGVVKVLNGVSLHVNRGEALGLVGESGSGKSMTCLAVLRLIPSPAAKIVSGTIKLGGRDLLALSERDMDQVRGRQVSMILQDPMTSLDPLFTVGTQIGETLRDPGQRKRNRVVDLLSRVRIPAPATRVKSYPHEMSGGMRQRVVAAVGLASEPALLLADEPTTALDVTVQMQFLDMLRDVQQERGLALLLVTHDLSVVARACDRAAVMYAGQIVETAPTRELLTRPYHPYTRALLSSIPVLGEFPERLPTIEGTPPDLAQLPRGCPFEPRCAYRLPICGDEPPPRRSVSDTHNFLCWLSESSPPATQSSGVAK